MPRLALYSVHHATETETALINIFREDYDPVKNPKLLMPYDDFTKEVALIEHVKEKVFPFVKKTLRTTQYLAMEVIGGEQGDKNVYINVYPHPNMKITQCDIDNLKDILSKAVKQHNKKYEKNNRNLNPSVTAVGIYKRKAEEVNYNLSKEQKLRRK